jgi:uncharacterized protein with PQ loop repeat
MDTQTLQVIAGTTSSLLFITGSIPMLLKAFKTRNLRSYSLGNLVLNNVGNLVHWLYISGLPVGPIWLLHSFYTLTMLVMLVWYLRFEHPQHQPAVRHTAASAENLPA